MRDWFVHGKGYYVVSVVLIITACAAFIRIFEKRRPKEREIVLMAALIALAAGSRLIFFMVPQIKPMAAIVILTGVALGKEAGALCGGAAVFVSNIFFGQGPWTPWQMAVLGLIGYFAGVLFSKRAADSAGTKKLTALLCLYGAVSTAVIYGCVMDFSSLLMYTGRPSFSLAAAVFAAGVPFNLTHALSTVVFLMLLTPGMLKKIIRVKTKFGMFYRT